MDRTKVIDKVEDFFTFFNPNNKGKVICILFWAKWCGACTNFIPLFLNIVQENNNNEKIIFINASETTAKDLLKYFKIDAFPTTCIFKIDDSLKSPKDYPPNPRPIPTPILRLEGGGDTNKKKIEETLQKLSKQ
jgi:thiol-disulfide isomerase/thioredoxin